MEKDQHQAVESGGIVGRAGIAIAGAVFGGILGLANEILLARTLGVEVYGLYALGIAITRIGEILSLFGLRWSVLHYLPVFLSQKRSKETIGAIWASLILPPVLGCALSTVIWLMAPWLAVDVFDKPAAIVYIRLLSLAISLMSLSEIVGFITRAYGHAAYYVIIRNVVPPLSFMVLLLILRANGADSTWVAGAYFTSYCLAVLVAALCLFRIVPRKFWRLRPIFGFRRLYGYAVPIFLTSILYVIVGWTDILMLGGFMAAEQVGIYRVCSQILLVIDLLASAFAVAVAHTFPVLVKEARREDLRQTYGTVVRWVTYLSLPLFLVIAANSHDILLLLGPVFTAGATTLVILAAGRLIYNTSIPAGTLLIVGGRPRAEAMAASVAAVLNIVLNLVLIPHYGISGAAMATTLSLAAMALIRVLWVRRILDLRTYRLSMWRVIIPYCAIALIVFAGATWLEIGSGTGLLNLVHRVGLMLALCAPVLWFVGFEREDREVLSRALRLALAAKDSRDKEAQSDPTPVGRRESTVVPGQDSVINAKDD